ncbi:MAG: pur operon repressor [bacterium]|nr:pur operon repressor [bacterium]
MPVSGSETRPRRGHRIAALVKTLADSPGAVFSLARFAGCFGAARSTISEDLAIVKDSLRAFDLGILETQAGPGGGVRYLPTRSGEGIRRAVNTLCEQLTAPERILPGGFLYTSDIIFSPVWASTIGEVFATLFARRTEAVDSVVTVETKGIPIALMTARALGLPLVIIRRDARVTEGPSVSISYLSGSTGHIQAMSLPRRALAQGAQVLMVDDFMRAGGTARAARELMAEFDATVVGTGVLTETSVPARKLVDNYLSLTVLDRVDDGAVAIRPGSAVVDLP